MPAEPSLDAYVRLFQDNPLTTYLFNSAVVSALAVVANLLFCSLAAYPLARLRFAGRGLVLALVVATILIPFQVVMIPLYLLMVQLGLRNTLMASGDPSGRHSLWPVPLASKLPWCSKGVGGGRTH